MLQVVVRKNPDATTDEERSRLETVGRFHTGVFINRISQGSLVRGQGSRAPPQLCTVINRFYMHVLLACDVAPVPNLLASH